MRWLAHLLVLALGLLVTFGARADASDPPPAVQAGEALPQGARDFRVTFNARVPTPAKGTRVVEVWLPLPAETPVQELRDLSVSAPIPFEVTREPVHGNRMVHVRVEHPTKDVVLAWTAVVRRRVEEGQETAQALPSHLEGDALAPVNEATKRLAAAVLKGKECAAVREQAHAIYDHVVDSIIYDKVEPGWGRGDFERVMNVCRGNCSDFTSKFITLARSAGIPARWVSTLALSEEHAGCDACGYHCYAHFLDAGAWVPVDPSDAQRVRAQDPAKALWYFGHAERHNVILSFGRDLTLAPPQKGPPVNYLAGPYVEIDGRPTPVDAKDRSYDFEAL